MTVKEPIEALQKFDSEKEIKIFVRDFRDYVDEECPVYSENKIAKIHEGTENSIVLRCE